MRCWHVTPFYHISTHSKKDIFLGEKQGSTRLILAEFPWLDHFSLSFSTETWIPSLPLISNSYLARVWWYLQYCRFSIINKFLTSSQQGATTVNAYFPNANWYDWYDGSFVQGIPFTVSKLERLAIQRFSCSHWKNQCSHQRRFRSTHPIPRINYHTKVGSILLS